MQDVVLHPETGRPAVVETSYRELELDAERNRLNDLQNELDQVTVQFTELSERKTSLESAVNDQKSLINRAEALVATGVEGWTNGDGSVATDEVEVSGDPSDAGEPVEVTVETPQF